MAERIPTDMDTFLREHAARATPLPEVREAALARWPHSPDADDDQRRSHAARIETAYKHRRKRARDAARAALAETSVPQEVLSEAARPCHTVRIEDVALADALTNAVRNSLLGVSIMEPITAPPCTAGDLAELIRSLPPPDAEYSADVQDISAGSTAPFDPLAEWTDGVDPAPFLRRIDAATRCGTDESVPRLQRMTEAVEALGVTVDNVRRAVEASPNRPVGHLPLFEVAAIAVGAIENNRQITKSEAMAADLGCQVGRLADAVSQMLSQAQDAAAAKDALIETQRRFIEHLQRMVGA